VRYSASAADFSVAVAISPGKEQAKLSSDAEIDRMFDQFQSSSNETIAFGVARDIVRQVKMGVSPKDLRLDSALKDTAGAVDVERGGGQADSSERTVALTRDQFHSLFADVEGQHGSQNEGLGTGANSDDDNDEYEAVFFSNVHAAATAPLRLAQPGADAGANASSDKTGLGMATNV